MENIVSKFYEYLLTYGMNILAAVIIFIAGRFAAGLASKLIEKLMLKTKVEKTIASFVKHIIYFGILLFVIVAALNKLGVQTTSLIAMIGAAGLAVGLALQGSLANFAAGIVLIVFKPFKVGDFIEASGVAGFVEELQIFNTVLNTLDNQKVIVPNAKVTGDNIINFTGNKKRRIDLVFGISYGDNIKTAREALERAVSSHPGVLKDPRPTVVVSELADSSVNLICRPWIKSKDYWDIYFELIEKGKLELEKAGITIPFPQRDVHLYQEK